MKRRGAIAFASVATGALAFFAAARADAQCQGRPTDPAGYQGYTYGTDVVKSYATARVRVHYALTGANAPDQATTRSDMVPDTVALAGEVGEAAFTKYASMGFKLPPSDASCTSNGSDDKIDIYLVSFAGADGTTVPDNCNGAICSSFVLCESTFLGRGYANPTEGFKTVVAHELFHTVQNGYDSDLDRFWAEGTAQWGMKQVYPELADFERQMPSFFKDTTRSLDTQPSGVTSGFLYGSAVWPLFLSLRHGPDMVRLVLEAEVGGTKAIAATDKVLMTKMSSIAADYPLFGAWNAATKDLVGTGGYPDAAKYPGVKIDTLADGVTGITSGLAYYVYRATLATPSLISLETDATRNGGVAVPVVNGKPDLTKATKLPANDQQGDVLVVVAGITTKKTDGPFTVHVGPATASTSGGTSGTADAGTSGESGGSSSSGGCTVTAAAPDPSSLPLAALALASLVLVRIRFRLRVRVRSRVRVRE